MSSSSGCDIDGISTVTTSNQEDVGQRFLMLASAMIIEKGFNSLRAAVTVGAAATRSTASIATNSKANLL
ncbi:hypothetical protein V6N13_033200 [Hibiscus sabdariffa]